MNSVPPLRLAPFKVMYLGLNHAIRVHAVGLCCVTETEWQTLCRAREFHPPPVKTTAFSLELSHSDTWSEPRELYLFWYGLHFFPWSNELRKHRAWRWDVEMCGRELCVLSHCKPERNGVGCEVHKKRGPPSPLVLSSSHPFILSFLDPRTCLCWSHVLALSLQDMAKLGRSG